MRIDHAIIAARDIEAVANRLWERHGLASLPGGRHPGWGTHNRIVPLAGPYLEIIGVADENEAVRDPMGRWLLANTALGDPLMGWCCETDEIEELARRLSLSLERGSRERPAGSRTWATQDAAGASAPGGTSRGRAVRGPASCARRSCREVHGFSRIEVGCSAEELRGRIADDLPVHAVGGRGALRALVIATADGEIRLTGDS